MRFLLVSLVILSVWAWVERHNTAESKKALETALATERKAKQELSNRLDGVAKELAAAQADLLATRDKVLATEGQLQVVQSQVGELANRPLPTPAPAPPAPEKKTWLQERVEQGNSLEQSARRANESGFARPPGTRVVR